MLSKITWSLFNLPSEYLDGRSVCLSLETNHALGDLCSRLLFLLWKILVLQFGYLVFGLYSEKYFIPLQICAFYFYFLSDIPTDVFIHVIMTNFLCLSFLNYTLGYYLLIQVADDSTLYGTCVLVEEMVQKPSGLISMISGGQPFRSGLSRHILTTRRCYCILSRLPFFELHFGILKRQSSSSYTFSLASA